MNKNQYRIIFNAHRGVRMAVAETAVSQGKSASGDSSGLAGAGLVKVVFNLTIGASLVFLCGLLSPNAEAQIVADRSAPGNQQPTVLKTASGLPQVNIQTPSAAGVSRNTYSQFDVSNQGAILNNSRTDANTKIGGLVQGNPWLAAGSARVILNEVNSSRASQLNGYIEVAGQRAEVIIANPAGIAVNGGGFLNASSVTLTTGTATMNSGNLDSFQVRNGSVSVNGAGLDTSTADYTNILARAALVNAGIWAKDLKVVTGANDVNVANFSAPSVSATVAVGGTAPAFALDVAAIGGMYAGKIYLVGTEAGLGIRNSGTIGATAGDVVITNEGLLTNSGSIYSNASTSVTTQGSIANTDRGLIAAQGNTTLKAQGANAGVSSEKGTTIAAGMDSAGSVANTVGSAGTLKIAAAAGANLNGQVASAADTSITAASIDMRGVTLAAQNATLTASSYGVDATGSNAVVRSNWSAAAQTAVVTDGATINAAQINIAAHELSNVGGKLLQNGSGDMAIVLPGSLNNTGGTIASNAQNLSLGAATITNTGGTISHAGTGTLGLAAGDLLGNAGTIVSNGSLQVQATGLVSLQGASTDAQSVNISATSLDNSGGHLQTNGQSGGQSNTGSLAVNTTGAFINNAGNVFSAGDVNIHAGSVSNASNATVNGRSMTASASIYASGNATLQVAGALRNSGAVGSAATIAAQGDTIINAQSVVSNANSLLAGGMQTSGKLVSSSSEPSGRLVVRTTGTMLANGQNLASRTVSMSGSSVDLNNSQTGGLNIDLSANNGDINTQGATIVTPGTLSVTAQANAQQTWNNSKGSTPAPNPTSTPTIQAGQLAVSVANLNNQGATIVQTGTGTASITLTAAQGTLNNSAGTIAANATDLTLGAATLNNAGGSIRHAGNGVLTVSAGTFSGNSGSVVSNGAMNLNASGAVELQNATSIAQQVFITAASLANQGGRVVQSSSTRPAANIAVTGALDNTGGFVGSNGALQINAGSITNANGQITALQSLGLTSSGLLSNRASTSSGAPNNVAGLIQSNGALSVQAASLDNTGATVSSAQGDVSIITSGQTNNTAGKITAAGDVNLTSSSLLNGNAGLLGANGALNLYSDSVQNGGGQIVSAGNVTVTGKSGASSAAALLDNTSGLVQSGATLRVNAGQIVNTATYTPPTSTATALGLLGKDIQLAANSLDNHNGEVLAGNNLNIQATQSIDNSQSGLLYAGKALKVQDSAQLANPAAARTLQVSNANGVLNAGTSNQVQAAGLSGTGQLLSQGDLSLDVSSDFNNSGTVNANGNTTLTSTGTVTNSGTLAAGKTLTVAAINLNNAASGKLSGAAGTNVLLTGTLNNRGLIDSGNSTGTSLTLIKAQTVNNLGTGRIYGDNVAIAANTLTNDVETVAGVTKTAVIASRNRLDIGAGTLNNANGATILSLGDMAIGGALDTSNHATGAAGTVTNSASQIQSVNGNLAINTGTLQNLNPTFSYQVVGGTPSAEKTEYILTNGQVVQDSQVAVDNGLLHTYTRAGGETAPYGKVLLNSDPLATTSNIAIYKEPNVVTFEEVIIGNEGHGGGPIYGTRTTLSAPQDSQIWGLVGQAIPANPPPAGERPPERISTEDGLVHNPAIDVWDAAAAPYFALQSRIDAVRAQMEPHMVTVQAYSAYTAATEQAVVSGGTPGTISSGGTITINASNSARNDNSQILAGGALAVNVPGGQLDNTSTNVTVHNDKAGYNFNWACVNFRGTSTCGVAYYNQFNIAGQPDLRQNPFTQSIPTTVQVSNSQALQYTSINAPVTQPAAATGGGGVVVASLPGQVSSVSQPALTAAQSGGTGVGNTAGPLTSKTSATSAQATSNPATRIASTTPSFKLPNSSLYQINNSPTAQYLVQTDPAFTSYQTWLSSDYVTSQVRLDPTVTQKRLGDGFYEQQLVREQVAQLTGRRFLGNYTSDQQQYQALMDSGLTFAKVQKLSPGIALSAAQIASLTSDIVWLEQQTVTLADGSTTQAIVPHVYAAIREGDLAPSGALLGGNSVAINTGGDVNNSGTIAGRKLVQISANSINNSVGSIDGQSVSLNAVQDINNIGGAVIADTNLALQAGRDINVTSTTQSSAGAGGNYSFSESGIDRVATLYTRGPGVLLASAGNNINLTAAQLSSGGDVQISAANNLTLSTITSSQSNNFGAGNADNHFLSSNSKEVGTTIQSAGNTALAAGNTLSATAANVNATGDLALSAKNIALLAGTSKASSDTVMTNSNSDMFSSSTTVTKESQASTSAVATAIGGRNVTINSQNDITVKASNVLADNNVSLAAGNNVNIVAGVNTQNTSSFTQKSESGFLSGGGLGVTYGSRNQSLDQKDATTTAATSTVGSIGGNVSINAGKTYTQSGSDVLTQGGNIDIAATNVKIEESRQTGSSQTQTKFEQSGISVGLSGGVIDTLQTTAQGLQGALTSGSNRNKALNALIAYGKGSDLVEQGKAVENAYNQNGVMGSEGNPGAAAASGIKVSISIGSSSSQSDSNTAANTAAASTVKAGGNVSIRASGQGQGEGDLTVQGSKVEAGGNTTLSATQNVNIVASADAVSNRSTNSSSADSLGVSFGVGKGSAGLSVDASASRGQGQANSDNVSYNNSLISAANKVSITSGADTNIAGGNVTAKEISATVGGNLNITSLQDNAKSNASQSTTGVSVGIPIGPGSASFSASQANQNSNSDYKSVNQQSGISAGDGGFQINVAGNTDLKGAVIASTNKAVQDGKNSLTTKTLTTSDLQNSMSGSASSSGTSVGTDMLQGKYNLAKTIVGNAINNGSANQSDASTAKSAISAAQVTVGGVTTDTGKAQLTDSNGKAVSTATTSTNRTLSKADVAGLQSQAQQQQADNMLLFQSLKMVGDKIYRKETEAKKLVQMTCAAANKEQCSATEVGIAQVKSVEKIVTAFNNGMLSTEQNALLTAYMQATGSQLQNGVLVIVNPQANDMVSEGAWVVWKKIEQVFGFGTSSAGQLNLALEAIAATQNAKVDTIDHSAGNFAVAERNRVLQDQGTTNAAIGTQTMFGSPVNAQDQANQVSAITDGEGTVRQATQQNDFVGRWFSLSATQGASNPATPSQTGSLGNPNVGGVAPHTAYTGDLTTSISTVPQILGVDKLLSPAEITDIRTMPVWGPGNYSQPQLVKPQAVKPELVQPQQP